MYYYTSLMQFRNCIKLCDFLQDFLSFLHRLGLEWERRVWRGTWWACLLSKNPCLQVQLSRACMKGGQIVVFLQEGGSSWGCHSSTMASSCWIGVEIDVWCMWLMTCNSCWVHFTAVSDTDVILLSFSWVLAHEIKHNKKWCTLNNINNDWCLSSRFRCWSNTTKSLCSQPNRGED